MSPRTGRPRNKPHGPLWWLLAVLVPLVVVVGGYVGWLLVGGKGDGSDLVPLTVTLAHLSDGDATSATLDENARQISLDLADGTTVASSYTGLWADALTENLLESGIDFEVVPPEGYNALGSAFVTALPILAIVGLLLFLMRGAIFRGKRFDRAAVPQTRFADVAGVDEAVAEMQELVDFLRDGDKFAAMGARTPRGALFVGPPGTGKTLLARAVAGESGVPFFQVNGSDFVEMFAGLGASRVRGLFKKAKEAGRAIIFIDEIDSVGRRRGGEASGNSGVAEMENTLTALLTEIDGFEQTDIIVIGATNRLDVLDPALRRRLEHVIQVPLPDRRGRSQILRVHGRGKPFASDADWDGVGRQAYGMSGAELERVVNEACMDAARKGDTSVSTGHLLGALSTIQVGRERVSAALTDRDKEITAWHEAGHAVACAMAEHLAGPTFVTIVPRGESGGHTRPGGSDDTFRTREQMLDELMMAMAGRAAEMLLLGEDAYTQGAVGDLQHATALASQMVTQFGMGSRLAQTHPESLRLGASAAQDVHLEVDALLHDALARARRLLEEHKDVVLRVAEALVDQETLSDADLAAALASSIAVKHESVPEPAPTMSE